MAAANAGSLWIAVDGLHTVRSRTHLARKVKLPLGVGTLHKLDITVDGQPVAEGQWLPRRIEVRTWLSVLGRMKRKRNTYRYSDFAEAAHGN